MRMLNTLSQYISNTFKQFFLEIGREMVQNIIFRHQTFGNILSV
jgi:hypothetical protein